MPLGENVTILHPLELLFTKNNIPIEAQTFVPLLLFKKHQHESINIYSQESENQETVDVYPYSSIKLKRTFKELSITYKAMCRKNGDLLANKVFQTIIKLPIDHVCGNHLLSLYLPKLARGDGIEHTPMA
jgi:hypothetical protein